MSVVIRAATVEDARAIAEIHVAGWRAAYRGQMPDAVLDGLSIDRRTEQWTQRIGAPVPPEQRTWVSWDGARVTGFANTGPSRDADARPGMAELFAIYVDPSAWGTGAGRALLAHAAADVSERGFAGMSLWVLGTNARARRFYERAGFRTDGEEKTATFGGAVLQELRYSSLR